MKNSWTAEQLRKSFRDIPRETRDSHQPFCIRVWRGLSWLERAEQAAEIEDRFIAAWISFNSLYGRQDEASRVWTEGKAICEYLATLWRLDCDGLVRSCLRDRQTGVLGLIGNKFLDREFWDDPTNPGHDKRLHSLVRELLPRFGEKNLLPVLTLLFDRLYIMRVQLFHGASTQGSGLNRRTLKPCSLVLSGLIPLMLRVMIDHGIEVDWGGICFPPCES